jgi:hypothetical protein
MIRAEDLEAAERVLVVSAEIDGLANQYNTVDIDPDAINAFVRHHLENLRRAIPDMDPRIEPNFNTFCRHALLVGILAGRGGVHADD